MTDTPLIFTDAIYAADTPLRSASSDLLVFNANTMSVISVVPTSPLWLTNAIKDTNLPGLQVMHHIQISATAAIYVEKKILTVPRADTHAVLAHSIFATYADHLWKTRSKDASRIMH